MNWQARCEVLTAENDQLRDRIAWLEEKIGLDFVAPLEFELSPLEQKVLGILSSAPGLVTKEQIMHFLYADRITDREVPDTKIVDVWICKTRSRLAPFAIEITTHWGQGYSMPQTSKAALAAHLQEAAA